MKIKNSHSFIHSICSHGLIDEILTRTNYIDVYLTLRALFATFWFSVTLLCYNVICCSLLSIWLNEEGDILFYPNCIFAIQNYAKQRIISNNSVLVTRILVTFHWQSIVFACIFIGL